MEYINDDGKISRRLFMRAAVASLALVAAGCSERSSPDQKGDSMPKLSSQPEAGSSVGEFSKDPSWSQDFTTMPNGQLDTSVWTYDLDPEVPSYNNEAQGYSNSTRNVRVEDGVLVIEARRESYQYPDDPDGKTYEISSGRIDTRSSFSFEYGKIEATMKLPKGKGTWPAFWMLSANQPFTAALHPSEEEWSEDRFYKHDGELDVLEAYGDKPGIVESTVHTFAADDALTTQVPDASDAFHTYGVEVTPTQLVWTIDGKPYHSFKKPSDKTDEWPFAQGNQFYVILNLAMGSYGGEVGSSDSNWKLEVQNLNFYSYTSA